MQVYSWPEHQGAILAHLLGDSWQQTKRNVSFTDYFNHIGVKVFLLEDNYIDRDYIIDYSSYFATCFIDYGRWCKRIHLFTNTFNKNEFEENLQANNSSFLNSLKSNYRGFIVIRPIPAHIGKTCLATYSNDSIRVREYPVTRKYRVNLYGIKLTVNSLAYQEQDGSVAVCASSALWSAFQKTGQLFQHKIPSPAQVTQLATFESHKVRSLPNKGLTAAELGVGIATIGLEPQLYTLHSSRSNKAIIYAYLKAGIPIICGLRLFRVHNNSHVEQVGEHAVTICGFSFENGEGDTPVEDFRIRAARITRIFCHDDQLCPFARMEFGSYFYSVKQGNNTEKIQLLDSNWSNSNDFRDTAHFKAQITVLLVPLYHKIRISYDIIEKIVNYFIEYITRGLTNINNKFPDSSYQMPSIEWDIYLSDINSIKTSIVKDADYPVDHDKLNFLYNGHPKYLWRAIAWIDNKRDFEFIFDATDIVNGDIYHTTLLYQNEYFKTISSLTKTFFDKDSSIAADIKERLFINSKSLEALIKSISTKATL